MRKHNLVGIHQLGAAFIDNTRQVRHINVLARNAQLDQQPEAGQRRCACARGDQLDFLRVFADHLQRIQNRCTDRDGGAMLVVMEHRNLHALAQLALDIKAVRRLDVFQVDAAKRGLQRGDDVHQLVQVVLFVDLEVKHVNAGKLLEQNRLALHHRLGRQRANVAQPQHRRAVGDDGHQVAARGVLEGVVGVFDDFFARRGDAG